MEKVNDSHRKEVAKRRLKMAAFLNDLCEREGKGLGPNHNECECGFCLHFGRVCPCKFGRGFSREPLLSKALNTIDDDIHTTRRNRTLFQGESFDKNNDVKSGGKD